MMMTVEEKLLALFDSEADELFRYCYYRLLDRPLATRTVEHAFKRLWEYVDHHREMRSLQMLLYRIANDVIAQERRSVCTLAAKRPIPQTIRTEEQHEEVFLRMLGELSEEDRDAFVLHKVNAQRMERVSDLLQESVPVVAARIARGTERMEELLRPYAS